MNRNFSSAVTAKNIDQLTRSLDRVRLYDFRGNQKKLLKFKKQNFLKILEGLSLEGLSNNMYF